MKLSLLTLIAAVAGLLAGCDKPEARLAPIADVISFAQRADLVRAGVAVPDDGSEFLLSTQQARTLFDELLGRSGETIAPPKFERYAVFLKEISDPVVRRARVERGHPRPFLVTVYERRAEGRLDRSSDVFFMSMIESNRMRVPTAHR